MSSIMDILNVPFGYVLRFCNFLIPNYAIALLLFAIGIILQSIAMWQLRSYYTVRLGVQSGQHLVTSGIYRRRVR